MTMRLLTATLTGLALAAIPSVALEKEFVSQMMDSAKNIERDASLVSAAVRLKNLDAEDVRKKIEAMSADLAKLQELVNSYEASHPKLSARDQQDWQALKEKVQLLEIFHGQKKQLAAGDFSKNRGLIRAHADGVVRRAKMLQQTVARLQRS